MTEHLTPLDVAIYVFGSIGLVADICGLSESAVHHWKRGSKTNDPYDIPSANHMRKLLRAADKRRLVLEPRWLISGSTKAEIDAATLRAAKQVAAE